MKRYIAVLKIGFKNALAYRTDFFLWGFNEFLGTLIFLFIWTVIFGEKNAIGGFTLPETITYLIGTGLISNITSTWVAHQMQKDIQSGWLSNMLIRPLSYSRVRLAMSISSKPVNLLIRTSVYIILAIFFRSKIILPTEIMSVFLVLVSVAIAFIISFLIDFLVGCIAFWTTTTQGVNGIMGTIADIFSGNFAPLTFFPKWFQSTASFLPYSYTRYFPMLIYLRKLSILKAIEGIGVQILWVVILYFVSNFFWKKGIRKYEGVGI